MPESELSRSFEEDIASLEHSTSGEPGVTTSAETSEDRARGRES
jgi:hypothetical protein